nr:hypothetical protein [Paracoccus saliphilus]
MHGNVVLALTPAAFAEDAIEHIQFLAEKALGGPIRSFVIDFGSEGGDLTAVYRTTLSFIRPDQALIGASEEARFFVGTHLGLLMPLVDETRVDISAIERLFALLEVSFGGITVGSTSLIATLLENGRLAPLGKAAYIIPGVEAWADPAILRRMSADLPRETTVALRAASAQINENGSSRSLGSPLSSL